MKKKSMEVTNKKLLLLVEDDQIQAMTVTYSLAKYGYKVIHTETAEKAIELIRTNLEIELILMDIDLGEGMDGTLAAKVILANRDIPLIFLSSHTDKETVEKTEQITSYGYVVKNSSSTVLDASIKMAFRLFYAKQKTYVIEDDLRTYQIELEMQNNDFRSRQTELEFLREKYFKVYHHSPVGLLTLNGENLILEVNHKTSSILGVLRHTLLKKKFLEFIFEEDRDLFYLYQKKINNSELTVSLENNKIFQCPTTRGFCELRMLHSCGSFFTAILTSTRLQDPEVAEGESFYRVAIMT